MNTTDRRATPEEIATARAWIEERFGLTEYLDPMNAERARDEYELALSVLVFANDRTKVAPPVLWRTHHGAEYSNVQAIPCVVIANGELADANGDPIQETEPAIAAEIARRGGTYRDHGYGVRLPGVIGLTPTVGCDHSS